MKPESKKWEIVNHLKIKGEKFKVTDIVDILLENRGIKTEKDKNKFFNPTTPTELTLKELGIDSKEVSKAIKRIEKAFKDKEKVMIYSDYDADGICAGAILWEALYSISKDVLPYVPERFSEGYGVNSESIRKLKEKFPDLGLIITVDNGIVANGEVNKIKKLGIDVIVTDHHQKGKSLPKAYSIIHTPLICGVSVAWILAREALKKLKVKNSKFIAEDELDLVAIGTIADQVPLLGANRSFAKFGLEILNKTKRAGLLAMFKEAYLMQGSIGSYEVGFIIAPRINAMGRMGSALDSLRILCIKDFAKAMELARLLGKTNQERQRVVEQVYLHAKSIAEQTGDKKVFILSSETYHEGVIGLAAGRIVEEFHRPAIVISKGENISKASARSISGFNIIEAIRQLEKIIQGGGGHPMAAGFSIETASIDLFIQEFEKVANPLLTDEILAKKVKIDIKLNFDSLCDDLANELQKFEPFGLGNNAPVFVTENVEVINAKQVGKDKSHLKLVLRNKAKVFEAIAFKLGSKLDQLSTGSKISIVYSLDRNIWNGVESLQLKVKDFKFK